jgi:outer membrane murein-binding lipoprotein Lpp
VVVVTVLGGTFTAVLEAGRLHESVAELEPKVQQVQASVDALRADVRADFGALRVSSDKLNDKMDQLLLSFLPKSK